MKNYTLNGKDMTIHLIVALIKNTSPLSILSMIQYFPKPFRSFWGYVNVKVDLPNYATKTDLKSVPHLET